MVAPDLPDASIERFCALAQGGAALEFSIGTGRVAIALLCRGVPVSGIEIAPPMVTRLRRCEDAAAIPVVIGDRTTARVPGEFALVSLVFNGLSIRIDCKPL